MESFERNKRVLDALYVAQGALFWLPVFVLWFSEHVTPGQVFWLEAVYYWSVTALEIPTGWGSDRFGRKPMLVLSGLGWASGAAVMAMSTGLGGLVVGQVLLATGRACVSGTDSAVLYETLQALGEEEDFGDAIGRRVGLHFGVLGLASMIGGWTAGWDLRIPYGLSVAGGLLAVGAALQIAEPPRRRSRPPDLAGIREALSNRIVWRVLLLASTASVVLHLPYELEQAWLSTLLPLDQAATYAGVVTAGGLLLGSFGSFTTGRLQRVCGPWTLAVVMTGSFSLIALLLAGMVGWPSSSWALLLASRGITTGLVWPTLQSVVQPELSDHVRATWGSIQSLAARATLASTLMVMGWVAGASWDDALPMLLGGGTAFAVVSIPLALALAWPGRPRHTNES